MAREPKLKFVPHFVPEGSMTAEDERAVLGAMYVAHGLPMPPCVAAPINETKTYHGMKAARAAEESRTESPVATGAREVGAQTKAPRSIGVVRGATLSPVRAGGKG